MTKQRWHDNAGEDTATEYRAHRSFPAGTSSTLRKTQKAYRIAGSVPEPSAREKARHIHPRRLRKQG